MSGATRRLLALAILGALVAGCGTDPDDTSAPPGPSQGASSTEGTATAPPASPPSTGGGTGSSGDAASYSDWELGAHPLPLRPDGYGEMGPTPRELRVRRFRTVDLLPPPADGRFHSSVGPVTPRIRQRMGETWSPACPVALDELRYLRVGFRGYDGAAHTGELVVAASEADDVVSVFRVLFDHDFPIEEMRLPTTADLDAHPTGDGNNTAAVVCRPARGQTSWSAHAYGLAVDVNPFVNPYRKGDVVLPELASAYLDRTWRRPGMALQGSLVVREFARIGWSWGGSWSSLKDYQHFSALAR